MEKMVLEHVNIQDIPAEWIKPLKDVVSTTYRITIESESEIQAIPNVENKKSWGEMPIFGMWKDRDDMKNPIDYVSQIRKPRF